MFGPATSFSPAQIRVHIRLSKSIKVLRRKKKKKSVFFQIATSEGMLFKNTSSFLFILFC